MSQLQQALDALAAADAAGNKEDAEALADLVRQLQAQQKAPAAKEPSTPINPLTAGGVGVLGGQLAGPMINKGVAAMKSAPAAQAPVSGAPAPSGGQGTPGQKYLAKTGYGAGEGSTVREVVEEYKSQQKPIGSGKISKTIPRGSPMGIDPFMQQQAAKEAAMKKAAEATAKATPMTQKIAQAMPGPVQKAGQFMSGAASSSVAPWLGRGLAGGAAGVQGADAYNRLQQGDYLGSGLSALGAAGSAASLVPTPITRIGGPAVSITAEVLKNFIDKKKAEKQEKAEGGLVRLADGGLAEPMAMSAYAMPLELQAPVTTMMPQSEEMMQTTAMPTMDRQVPLPFQRAQTMNRPAVAPKRVVAPPRRPVTPPRPQLMARPPVAQPPATSPRMPAPKRAVFPTQTRPGGLSVLRRAEGGSTTPAWQRSEGKNPEGGLNAKGRASYNRETGGNLKAPQPEGGPRKKSFCARMSGMKKKLTSSKTANDPDSRINKALRKWKC